MKAFLNVTEAIALIITVASSAPASGVANRSAEALRSEEPAGSLWSVAAEPAEQLLRPMSDERDTDHHPQQQNPVGHLCLPVSTRSVTSRTNAVFRAGGGSFSEKFPGTRKTVT